MNAATKSPVILCATTVWVTAWLVGLAGSAHATILPFSIGTGSVDSMNPIYGDNVAGSPQSGYIYLDGGEGWTPNVTVAFSGGVGGWVTWNGAGFTDLTGVAYNTGSAGTTVNIEFQAAAGYKVQLLDFQLANWEPSNNQLNAQVFDAGGAPLTALTPYTVPAGATHGSMVNIWATPAYFEDTKLTLSITYVSGPGMDWFAFDNIRFAEVEVQEAAVPEPSTLALAGLGLLGAAVIVIRRRARK